MGMVNVATHTFARPASLNGTKTERNYMYMYMYTGSVEVTERQTADLMFRFYGTVRNGNITIFMPPTVQMYVHIHMYNRQLCMSVRAYLYRCRPRIVAIPNRALK